MLSVYPALFYQEENGISVVFPDLNHLSTCGDDMQEAMEMAVDCLAGYLFSEKLDGNEVPVQSGSVVRIAPAVSRCTKCTGEAPLIYLCIQAQEGSLQQYTMGDGVIEQ